jgi:hypothetical protein
LFLFQEIPNVFNAIKRQDQESLKDTLLKIQQCLRKARKVFEKIPGKYPTRGGQMFLVVWSEELLRKGRQKLTTT